MKIVIKTPILEGWSEDSFNSCAGISGRLGDYINANRHLLSGRPQSYKHGDYHIGNMMIDDAGRQQEYIKDTGDIIYDMHDESHSFSVHI